MFVSHCAVLNELFNTRHILTAEECLQVATDVIRWETCLVGVLSTKSIKAVHAASQVLEGHGFSTEDLQDLKSEFQLLLYCHM